MKNRWAFAGRRGVAGLLAVLLLLGAVGCHNDPPIEGESSAQTDVTDPSGIDSTTDPNGTTGTDVTTGDGTDVTTGDNGTSRPNTDKTTGNNTTTVPTTTPPLSGDFSIVKDGAATSTIVISTNAGDDVRAAAEDLQACIRKMTGATVPIGFDSVDRTNGNFILVGPSKYTDQLGIRQPTGFPDNEQVILKRSGNYLVLMGNDDQSFVGTQNAVTMFLEMQGCGWFGPDELWQVYPSTQNISVGSLDIVHKPKFTVRHNRVDAVKGVGNRWYLNGPESLTGHYLPTIIPKDTYFRTHPEWFSEIDGVRTVSATWWQYCYSNQEFAQEVAKKIIQTFDDHPNWVSVPVTPNDGWNDDWCECSECSKFASYTDVVLEFANRVAREVGKKYPDKKISILSYHATWFAPTAVKAEPNVEVMFCRETSMTSPIENGLYMGDTRDPITHNIYKTSWKDNFRSFIQKGSVKNVSIWEWYCVSASKEVWKDIPWVQGDVAIRNQNYWKSNGAQYIFYDHGPEPDYNEYNSSFPLRWPLWYVAAKGMWDASLTGDQILMDACSKLFGNAASEMYGYYKALADASESCTAYSMTWVPPEPSQMYTATHIRKIDAAIAKAKAKLNSVSADEKKRMQNQISYWENAKKLF